MMRMLRPEAFLVRPAAVLFDLDHTLYEYEQPHGEAMAAARAKVGRVLNVAGPAFDAAFDAARRAVKARLGTVAASHSRLLYFAATMEGLGFGAQPLLALDLEQTYWRSFLGAARLAEGAEDLLIELRAMGVKLGLVTDLTAQIQFRKLVYFGLDRYFDAVVTSEEAGVEKVGGVPFTLAAGKLGLDAEAVVWMVGDSDADIGGAKRALGAVTVQKVWSVGGGGAHASADAVVREFSELMAVVQAIG